MNSVLFTKEHLTVIRVDKIHKCHSTDEVISKRTKKQIQKAVAKIFFSLWKTDRLREPNSHMNEVPRCRNLFKYSMSTLKHVGGSAVSNACPIQRPGPCTSPRARVRGLCARLRPGRCPWEAWRGARLLRSCKQAWALPATPPLGSPCGRSRPSGSRSTSSRSWGGRANPPRGWWGGRWARRKRWCRSTNPPTCSCRRYFLRCPCGGGGYGGC